MVKNAVKKIWKPNKFSVNIEIRNMRAEAVDLEKRLSQSHWL